MLELVIGLIVLALTNAYWNVRAHVLFLPRLTIENELAMPELKQLQSEYEGRYPKKVVIQLVPFVLSIYLYARALNWPKEQQYLGSMQFLLLIGIVILALLIPALLYRYFTEKELGRRFPNLLEGTLKATDVVISVVVYIALIVCFALAASYDKETFGILFIYLGLLIFIVRYKTAVRSLKRKYELGWESSLGIQLSAVATRFGFTPKKLLLVPSIHANGFAWPDGTIVVTSALTMICSDEEVAAIVAHEFSHARDNDARKLKDRNLLLMVLALAMSAVPMLALQGGAYAPAVILSATSLFLFLVGMIVHLGMRGLRWRLEYKCDAAAKGIGLGSEMASALEKITRYSNQPEYYVGLDRFTITHPPVGERVRLLRA